MKNILFTITNCEKCKFVKDMFEIKGIDFEEINTNTDNGMKLVEKYGIGRVPTLIVLDKDNEIVDSVRGIDEIEGFFS
jgi:glutaredoxin